MYYNVDRINYWNGRLLCAPPTSRSLPPCFSQWVRWGFLVRRTLTRTIPHSTAELPATRTIGFRSTPSGTRSGRRKCSQNTVRPCATMWCGSRPSCSFPHRRRSSSTADRATTFGCAPATSVSVLAGTSHAQEARMHQGPDTAAVVLGPSLLYPAQKTYALDNNSFEFKF